MKHFFYKGNLNIISKEINYENIKETISKIVDDHWPEFYVKIEKSFSIFLHELHKVV